MPRADKGSVKFTERDLYIFEWLAEQKAVWETDLPYLLARYTEASGEPARYEGALPGPSAVRQTVDRWHRAEVAEARKFLVGQPRIVRLLPGGAALVKEPTYKESAVWTMLHAADVSRVRLWMEAGTDPQLGGLSVAEWISERRYRQDLMSRMPDPKMRALFHVPDGVAMLASGERVAVEVERTEKSLQRLEGILRKLADEFDWVVYAVQNPNVKGAVTAAHNRLKGKLDRFALRLLVVDYPDDLATGGTEHA